MRLINIMETPLVDMGEIYTNHNNPSFRPTDQKAIQQYLGVKKYKIENLFKKTPYNFQIYFRDNNSDATGRGFDRYDMGHSYRAVDKNIEGDITGININHLYSSGLASSESSFWSLAKDNAITIILAQNEGTQRVSLTPWIIAHRIVHAILSIGDIEPFKFAANAELIADRLNNHLCILKNYTQPNSENYKILAPMCDKTMPKKAIAIIADTKSAREGTFVNTQELIVDMMTQYIVKGPLIYDLQNIQKHFGFESLDNLQTNQDLTQQDIEQLKTTAEELLKYLKKVTESTNNLIEKMLKQAVGKVFVL